MNQLVSAGKDLSRNEVELEKVEDYALIDSGQYVSFFQVKASLSLHKWDQYEEALKKLIKHRDENAKPSVPCYFVVAREITDWDSDTNPNPYKSKVNIFNIDNSIVGLSDVKSHVIDEIEKLMISYGKRPQNAEAIYGSLCIFLDECISKMHSQPYRKRKYRISYSDILDAMIKSVDKIQTDVDYEIKERIYEHMINVVKSSMNTICNNRCRKTVEDCVNDCPGKIAVEEILELQDVRHYCELINPDIITDWNDQLSYAELFTREKIQKYILKVFVNSVDCSLVKENGKAVGLVSKVNPLKKGLVIPTLLRFEEQFKDIESSMERKLQALKDNNTVTADLYGNTIVVDSHCDDINNSSLSQTQITAAWDRIEGDENSIGSVPDDIGFLSYAEILKYFEENGGNHEC